MSDKNSLYNTVFSLIEEELHQRLNPSGYTDNRYDGTKTSICGSSNLDISSLENERVVMMSRGTTMSGGARNDKKFVPGKFEAVKHSYRIPLNVALQGTVERQRLFLEEQQKKNTSMSK